MTTPLNCPNCGAPAQNVAFGQTIVTCGFCRRVFQVAAPLPPPPPVPYPPPPQVVQRVIVIEPGASFSPQPAITRNYTGLVSLITTVFIMGIVGVVVWQSFRQTGLLPGGSPFSPGWSGASPLVCGGNDMVEASDVSASYASGAAITAGGNCHITCTRCRLRAPVVVAAGGNAQITFIDSDLEGTQSVVAGGNAQVKVLGAASRVTGSVMRGGNAEVTLPPNATPATGSPATAPPTPPPGRVPSAAETGRTVHRPSQSTR